MVLAACGYWGYVLLSSADPLGNAIKIGGIASGFLGLGLLVLIATKRGGWLEKVVEAIFAVLFFAGLFIGTVRG